MAKFILDANIFIQAEHDFYDFNIVPAFWELLEIKIKDKTLYSLYEVYDELVDKKDVIRTWARKAKKLGCFIELNPHAVNDLTEINDFILRRFKQNHADEFFDGADQYLIAQAKFDGSTIVTFEKYSFDIANNLRDPSKKSKLDNKVRIPDICAVFGIKWINLYTLLKKLKPTFILKGGEEWKQNCLKDSVPNHLTRHLTNFVKESRTIRARKRNRKNIMIITKQRSKRIINP